MLPCSAYSSASSGRDMGTGWLNNQLQFRHDVALECFPCSLHCCQKSRCGFTLFTVHTCGGTGLQVLPCVLHRLEVGEIFIKATQLPGVYKIPDGFHEFSRALLTVLHHSLVACPVCYGKFVLRKRFTASRFSVSIIPASPLHTA